MDVVLQSRTPKYGLGRHHPKTAAGHGRIAFLLPAIAKNEGITVAYQLERVLTAVGIEKGEAFVRELGRNRTFHDRELTFEAVDQSGCSSTHRYFLTGGID
jgi:hypothetical protein